MNKLSKWEVDDEQASSWPITALTFTKSSTDRIDFLFGAGSRLTKENSKTR